MARPRRSETERSVLAAVRTARLAVPFYGEGRPLTTAEVRHVARVFNVETVQAPIETPAILTCPLGDPPRYRLVLRRDLSHAVETHITLHECAHVLRGDVQEPTVMMFTGSYPEWEHACDLFALLGLLDEAVLGQGSDYLAGVIRRHVPLDDYGWRTYRVPELARRLPRMQQVVKEWL